MKTNITHVLDKKRIIKMLKKIKRIAVFFLFFLSVAKAQDPHFSQFYSNTIFLNPALAGTSKCPRINLNYRNQYPALNNAFVTYSASLDAHYDELNGGIGFHVMNDQQADGLINTTYVDAVYSYSLKVNNNFSLKGGLQFSYIQHNIKWGELVFSDMIINGVTNPQPTEENIEPRTKYLFDFSAGIVGWGKNVYIGVAAHHLPQGIFVNNDYDFLPLKYTAHFGASIPLFRRGLVEEKLRISPNIIYQRQQNFEQINYGLFLARKLIVFGGWFRQDLEFDINSYILLAGFVFPKFRLAYSFDWGGTKTMIAHEISLSIDLKCRQKIKKFKPISCPVF